MIKKTITFADFDGNPVTEIHYFHLSRAELIEMELSTDGGMQAKLIAIGESGVGRDIISTFKDFISRSYGQRDPAQPTKFFKSTKLTDEFMTSLAYDALFTELMASTDAAIEFVNGLFPKDMSSSPVMQKAMAEARMTGSVDTSTNSSLPDPNGLDSNGPWPRNGLTDYNDNASGLKHPRDNDGKLLPWAFRNATTDEQKGMTREQMQEIYLRLNSGWTQPF